MGHDRVNSQLDVVTIERRWQEGTLRPLMSHRVKQEVSVLDTSSMLRACTIEPAGTQELRPLEPNRIKRNDSAPELLPVVLEANPSDDSTLGTCTIEPSDTLAVTQELHILKPSLINHPSIDSTIGTCPSELSETPTCNVSEIIVVSSDSHMHVTEARPTELRSLEEKLTMQQKQLDVLRNSFEARDTVSVDICNRLQAITAQQERLNTICTSFEAREAIQSDLSIRLLAIEEQQQRLDALCTSREAISSNLYDRLQAVEEAVGAQRENFQADIHSLQDNQNVLRELRQDFRVEQEKQELLTEKVVAVTSDLEKLFSSAQLEHQFKELQAWTTQQVASLKVGLEEFRNSVGESLPLGALVEEASLSITEHKQRQDSINERVQHDLEQLQQKVTFGSEHVEMLESKVTAYCRETDQLQEDVIPLRIDVDNLDKKMENYIKLAKEMRSISESGSITSKKIESGQEAQIVCRDAELDALRDAFRQQAAKQFHADEIQTAHQRHLDALHEAITRLTGGPAVVTKLPEHITN